LTTSAASSCHSPRPPRSVSARALPRHGTVSDACCDAKRSLHLLMADEPLNVFDPPVAVAIVELRRDIREMRGLAIVPISHDTAAVPPPHGTWALGARELRVWVSMGVCGLAIRRASRKGRGSATPWGGMAEPRPQRVVMHGCQDMCTRY